MLICTLVLTMALGLAVDIQQTPKLQQNEAPVVVDARDNRVYTSGPSVSPPHLMVQVDPIPPNDQVARLSGIYTVQLVVEISGRPSHIKILKGISPKLDQAIIDAVEQYVFRPAYVDEAAVPTRLMIEIRVNMPYKHREGLLRR